MANVRQNAIESCLVGSIDFGLFDPEKIEMFGACEITENQMMDKGEYVKGGLSDLRMGTQTRERLCDTCGRNQEDCPGHFGYIRLAEPFFHVGFLPHCYKLLQMVCHKCGRVLCSYSDPEIQYIVTHYKGKNRFLKLFEKIASKSGKCQHSPDLKNPNEPDVCLDERFWELVNGDSHSEHVRVKKPCNATVPAIEQGKDFLIKLKDVSKTEEDYLSAEVVLRIFENISDQDVRLLGFNPKRSHPKWMILKILPVPPLAVRPQVVSPGQSAPSQDDITHKLSDIIICNKRLRAQRSESSTDTAMKETRTLLQYHITTYMINDKPSIERAVTKSGRPLKVISQRLKGKEGHLRGHLSGKRDDYSARSVISPDPSISIDQVGVPEQLAKILTFPEVVTPTNQKWLESIVMKGHDDLGGANFVINDHGTRTDLSCCTDLSTITLSPGYIVERHLRDDDIVIFNRQPSLHKMSMMGHRALIMSGRTFRLNLCDTTPYNADFDGDEMNLHVPQSQTARTEVRHIMAVPKQIISPQANKPVIGLVQDALLGCRLLSKRDTFLTRNQVMNLMMWLPTTKDTILPPPCILKPVQLWSGKQVFSLFLPKISHNSYSQDANKMDQNSIPLADRHVIIRDGNLLAGILDKKTVARSEGSLIHVVINSYNTNIAKDFLNQTQLIVNNWLEHRGFSIGLIDCVVPDFVLQEVKHEIDDVESKVQATIIKAQDGQLERMPGMSYMQSFETEVNNLTNEILSKTYKVINAKIRRDNSLSEMLSAGSKGADTNMSQIIGVVGQQNMEGKRVKFGFNGRTLPHFQKHEYGLVERGFCKNSYIAGLTPPEFLFHAMGGRTGIIDTACKTSDTGYIQRRLVKSMESHHVAYDGTVRNSQNEIVQFIYGGDGLDATGLETQRLALVTLNDEDFMKKYHLATEDPTFGQVEMDDFVLDEFLKTPNKDKFLKEEENRLREYREILQKEIFPNGSNTVVVPVNIARIIESSQRQFDINVHVSKSDLNPLDIISRVDECVNSLIVVKGNDNISRTEQENATLLLRIMLYSHLSAKQCIFEYRLNEQAFKYILGSIKDRFYRSIVAPGEMVGTIAGQSIGEPSTQMTLNTFHFAGISAHDVTLGVPRLNELMNLAKHIRTPSVTVEFERDVAKDEEIVKAVRAQIESASFKKFVIKAEIYYDPNPEETIIEPDTKWINTRIRYGGVEDRELQDLAPWVLRFEINREEMIASNIESISDIVQKIKGMYGDKFFVIGDDDARIIRMQARLKDEQAEFAMDVKFLRETEQQMYKSFTLKGIPGISRVKINSAAEKMFLNPETHGFDKEKVSCLYTEGTAFREILSLDHVDTVHTITNDIYQVCDVLGIEAARHSLSYEMMLIMENAGAALNRRHLDLLADTMTQYGVLYPVSRHGINKTPTGTLMRASYEMTNDVFFDAAVFSEIDYMRDVSSNIIAGKPSRAGTGIVEVLINEDLLPMTKGNNGGEDLIGPATPSMMISPVPQGYVSQDNIVTSPFQDMPTNDIVQSPMSPVSPIESPLNGGALSPMLMDAQSPYLYGAENAASPIMTYKQNYSITMPSPSYQGNAQLLNTTITDHAYSPIAAASPLSPQAMGQSMSPLSPAQQYDPTNFSPAGGFSNTRYNPLSPQTRPMTYSPNNDTPYSPTYEPKKK